MKIIYKFRAHNKEEIQKVSKFLKNRKFSIQIELNEWIDMNDLTDLRNFEILYPNETDIMIRVYFNNELNRNKFKKEIQKTIGTGICGNDNCEFYATCEYSPYSEKSNGVFELLWRCIKNDEYCRSMKED